MSGNQASPTRLGGWKLVALTAALVTGLIELELFWGGRGEEGWRAAVRATAAVSVGLFLVTYLASTLRRLHPTPTTLWLLRNRRYLGVSFAVVHFAHFGSIIALSFETGIGPPIQLVVLGGLGDVLLIAMVLTSFDRSAAWLGARRWSLLHQVGLHYVWGIFALTYGWAALRGGRLFPALALVALLGALGLRVVVRLRRRSAVVPSA